MTKKDKVTTIRWPIAEYDKIAKRADRLDISIAEYVRLMVDKGERSQDTTTTRPGLDW
jgi:hypothetical protein